MTEADSLELIKNGESITVEFKKSTNEIMYTENANRAHGHGMLELSSFQPFPKNPAISKIFRETSLADELGSGMRNTYKYTKLYSGGMPSGGAEV